MVLELSLVVTLDVITNGNVLLSLSLLLLCCDVVIVLGSGCNCMESLMAP